MLPIRDCGESFDVQPESVMMRASSIPIALITAYACAQSAHLLRKPRRRSPLLSFSAVQLFNGLIRHYMIEQFMQMFTGLTLWA